MGSFLGFKKGDAKAPLIKQVIDHNRAYNLACERRWNDRPLYIKLLFTVGIRKPSYRWAISRSLYDYWPPRPKT